VWAEVGCGLFLYSFILLSCYDAYFVPSAENPSSCWLPWLSMWLMRPFAIDHCWVPRPYLFVFADVVPRPLVWGIVWWRCHTVDSSTCVFLRVWPLSDLLFLIELELLHVDCVLVTLFLVCCTTLMQGYFCWVTFESSFSVHCWSRVYLQFCKYRSEGFHLAKLWLGRVWVLWYSCSSNP
jgi:hypothetical protein